MRVDSKCCNFQSVVLELVREKLNMMLTEMFQLKQDIDFEDYEKLTKIILREISRKHVHSVHMSSGDAKNAIEILDTLEKTGDKYFLVDGEQDHFEYSEDSNPFSDSPF